MKKENQIAFKEWASIVQALSEGKQILIIRKGGIREETGEFKLEHQEFFLFPTYEHQNPEDLKPEAHGYLKKAVSEKPKNNQIPIRYYAKVQKIIRMENEIDIPRINSHHVWSEKALTERFHFGRRKGFHVLAVRIYRLPETVLVPYDPDYAGCKSWVDLKRQIKTEPSAAVLSDSAFKIELETILSKSTSSRA